jgi:hypothetical protein
MHHPAATPSQSCSTNGPVAPCVSIPRWERNNCPHTIAHTASIAIEVARHGRPKTRQAAHPEDQPSVSVAPTKRIVIQLMKRYAGPRIPRLRMTTTGCYKWRTAGASAALVGTALSLRVGPG